MLTTQALKVGFGGGLVVDFPNSAKAKKYYLVLMVGGSQQVPQGYEGDGEQLYVIECGFQCVF